MAFFFIARNWLFCYVFRVGIFERFSISTSVSLSILSSIAKISLLPVSRSIWMYFFQLFLSIVMSLLNSLSFTYTLFKRWGKFQSVIFINFYPLWEPCAILKQQKERLPILSIEKKHVWKTRVTLPQQQKTFITLSPERKVCIIGVEIRQPVVKS